jgi:hypothetical protein
MVDLWVRDEGTVVAFRPVTETGRKWIDENIISEPWQWLGNTLAVDRRYADPIIQSASFEGLKVSYEGL